MAWGSVERPEPCQPNPSCQGASHVLHAEAGAMGRIHDGDPTETNMENLRRFLEASESRPMMCAKIMHGHRGHSS